MLEMFMQKQTEFFMNKLALNVDGELVESSRITSIIESVGYWRDFFPMHKWMIENVQYGRDDRGRYWVTEDDLRELADYLSILRFEEPEYMEQCNATISQINNFITENNITEFSAFYYQSL